MERCALLGLTFIRVNHPHLTQPSMIAVSHCPLATARIAADGNCFFLSVSLAVTGSQEFHEELRLLITTYMIHKSTDPMLSSLGSPDGSMESYMKRSRMQTLGTWATELEVIAAASLLNTYMPNVEKHSNGSSIHHRKLSLACIKMKAYI